MPDSNGFTLIEILIVLVIISIVAGVAVMSIRHNDEKQLEMLSDRLVNVINLATEEAMLRPATLGLAIQRNTFQFYLYTNNEDEAWQPISSGPLAKHTLGDHYQLKINVDNKPVTYQGKPQLIFSPNGDFQPFSILLSNNNSEPSYQVKGDASGIVFRDRLNEKS